MRTRDVIRGALLAAVALTSRTDASRAVQSRAGASEVPCAAPLSWRVARVDEEFGIDVPRATAVLREAADMWERVSRRPLFVLDPTDGFPVRFVYDERQERTQERLRRERELEEAGRALDVERAEVGESVQRLEQAQARHVELLREYEARVSAHNETVRMWNDRGGAPDGVARQLATASEALAVEREELEARGRDLDGEARALRDRQERLSRRLRDHNRRLEALARDFPPLSVESGIYREEVRTEDGRVVSVGREIRIYRFGNVDELRLVAAHELGHALGLGHSAEPAAVMNEQHVESGSSGGVRAIHPADVELLAETCPDLAGRRE